MSDRIDEQLGKRHPYASPIRQGNGCAQVTAEYIRDLLAENAALKKAEKLAFVYAFAFGFEAADTTSRSCISAMDDAWEAYQQARALEATA